jgi:hypothetical protein
MDAGGLSYLTGPADHLDDPAGFLQSAQQV